MSKGYAVYPLMKQPRENVINEEFIRSCIYFAPPVTTDEECMRVVGNREEALRKEKTRKEVEQIPLHKVSTLTMSFRRIGRIENLYGLGSLTKLCLDNNHIKKIENLDHLTQLQWLDLSFNQIEVIENLSTLTMLEHLSLFSNEISSVAGLPHLKQLTTLSLGKNKVENLDDTARSLHYLSGLRVLTLSGCRIATMPHYRARMLAFVSTLRFLDGQAVDAAEREAAREDQRANLLPTEEEDERIQAVEKAQRDEMKAVLEYERYNCPDENKLYDDLFRLHVDGRNMMEILRSELVISAVKETLDRHQSEFTEKAKELADTMKATLERRVADDEAYQHAVSVYKSRNAAASKELIKQFEKTLKQYVPMGIGESESRRLSDETVHMLDAALQTLKSNLIEHEADQYDALEILNNGTLAKWKGDAVDVLLQSTFEGFLKLEADLQVALRQNLDALSEQRQKRDHSPDDLYFSGKQDEYIISLLDNREEYHKLLADWGELRRKHLEELELLHLKREENLLGERMTTILRSEQERHRTRLDEICKYVTQMSVLIDTHLS